LTITSYLISSNNELGVEVIELAEDWSDSCLDSDEKVEAGERAVLPGEELG
jgi:hypothetical protein